MAIQALSVFAGLYSNRTTELTLHVTHSGEADSNHTISVTQDNAIVLQSVEVGLNCTKLLINRGNMNICRFY